MTLTPFDRFVDLARDSPLAPVWKEVRTDLLTPVSAFLAWAGDASHAFLLESIEGGERVGRYSFIGRDPFLTLRADGDHTAIEGAGRSERTAEPFLTVLRRHLERYRTAPVPDLPPLTSGAVGYFPYDAAAWFEPALRRPGGDTPTTEPATFMFFDTVVAFDSVRRRSVIVTHAKVGDYAGLRPAYDAACARIAEIEQALRQPVASHRRPPSPPTSIRTTTDAEPFERAVGLAKEAIAAGDAYQVVLSRRFETDITVDPFSVYRALRHVNPSPYLYFLRVGDLSIAGSSPEMLVRVGGRTAETHPIAGTRPRGATRADDEVLATELLANEKECAEHVMLVDLGRNDLGRVCEYGSVEVTRFMEVVRFSHVMHIASTVRGTLAEGRGGLDALASCFPAGTVSGAPKIRAMQIIADLEPHGRGLYAGGIGYIDFAGNLDFCIAIRTIVMRGGRATMQAGAGIVFDSDPTAEFAETSHKADALRRALDLAHARG